MATLAEIKTSDIFIIKGGFQYAQQTAKAWGIVKIEKIENSDYPVQAGCHGQLQYTNAWHVDLDVLKKELKKWLTGLNYQIEIV